MALKMFNKKKTKPSLTWIQAVKCRPVKHANIMENRLETGEALLTYPIQMRPWITGIVKRFGKRVSENITKKLQLDPLGTEVWDLMDGKRTVLEIVQTFAKNRQLQTREAEISVARFIRELGKRGLIGLK